MKPVTLTLVFLAFAVLASPARADAPACGPIGTGVPPSPAVTQLGVVAQQAIVGEIAGYLGGQFAGFSINGATSSWDVGIAPGPLDVETVRAWTLARIGELYPSAEAESLRAGLRLVDQPYGDMELNAVRDALVPQITASRVGAMVVIACAYSTGRRVEVSLVNTAAPDQLAAIQALAAPYGDRVIVQIGPWGEWRRTDGKVPATPQTILAKYVGLPRCSHARFHIRANPRYLREVKHVTLTAAGHRTVFSGRALKRSLRLTLSKGTKQVRIGLRLVDGGVGYKILKRC
jgi:hypothetical protein